jgi:hypothetical protein
MKRRTLIAAIGAGSAVLAAGLYRFTDLFVKHYSPTPYDDLLVRLTDREQAAKLGAHVPGTFDPGAEAARLRVTFRGQDLRSAILAEVGQGRVAQVDGWVMPQTLIQLSALAAKV